MSASGTAGPSHAPGDAAPQWRQFAFFDLENVTEVDDAGDSTGKPPKSLQDLTPPILVTGTTAGSPLPSSLIVASGPTISILDRHLDVSITWTAWEGKGRATAMLESGGLLVVIGDEEGNRYPVLKIWDLTREERRRKGGGPLLLRHVNIQHGQRPHPVSAVALTSNLSHLAVGLGDGTVLLYRHLLQSLTTAPTNLTSMPKARVIHESPEPVTGLGFREPGYGRDTNDRTAGQPSLFIVTISRVLSASVSSRAGEPAVLESSGADLGCAAMAAGKQELIVARDDAIYTYGAEGRVQTLAYGGQKSAISVFRDSLIITSPPFTPSAGSKSATVRQYVSKNGTSSSDIAKITIFDLQNKLISYSGTFKDGVRQVAAQWGGIFIFGGNGKLSRLDEQFIQTKLDALYRKNLFTLAITVADNAGMDDPGISEIHKRYGDYLYDKGDFDGAMNQFVQTLGHLQPSYVIRQASHSAAYLQALHSHGLANPDHTTLLLNCYTKTSDHDALDAFLRSETHKADQGDGLDDLPFDLETAIRVCRQAGFSDHASYLANRYGRHEEYLRIQIEDAGKYEEALRYLRGLGAQACQENLMLYGPTLLQHVPNDTTALLIDLCAGTLGREPVKTIEKAVNGAAGPAVLSYLGYNRMAGMFTGEPAQIQGAEEVNGDRKGSKTLSKDRESSRGTETKIVAAGPSYTPPSPRQYFAHFVEHRDLFIEFLESVASILWGQDIRQAPSSTTMSPPAYTESIANNESSQEHDQRAVWNTLLELYLANTQGGANADSARQKALSLLYSDLPYDTMHALLLCSINGFTDGSVRLWERLGMYEDVLRFHMDAGNGDKVIKALDQYGAEHPHLYPMVLRWITGSSEVLEHHGKDLARILQEVDERRLLPPLTVVQILSRNGVASVGNVKEWLRGKVAETKQDIESDRSLVQSYRTETATKTAELASLSNPSIPETFQVTRCASCNSQLDLPTVHFMCKHSYHQRCLSDSEPECILCARQHAIIKEVRRNQTRLADRHELFTAEVQDSDDGFAVVAGAFGRGLMELRVEG